MGCKECTQNVNGHCTFYDVDLGHEKGQLIPLDDCIYQTYREE